MSKNKKAVVREELVAITGNAMSAIYLNQFLYWSERRKDFDAFIEEEKKRLQGKLEVEPTHGWIFKSSEELDSETMFGLSPTTVRKYIKQLIDLGFLEQRRNPSYAYDQTYQYRPNILAIQKAVMVKGYVLSGYKITKELEKEIGNAIEKIGNGFPDFSTLNSNNWKAIPETTTETTTKTTTKENTTPHLPHTVPLPTSTKQSVNGGGYEDNMANETLASFERGWNQAQSGQTHPIDTLWQGIDNDTAVNEQADMAKVIRDLEAKVAELEGQAMAKDHLPAIGNMMANHSPDTGNMVSETNDNHIGNGNKMVLTGDKLTPVAQASPLPLGFATPLTNTQNMATDASNQSRRIVGQNNAVSKPVKVAKPVVEKQPDLAQDFLKRWCEEVLCYGKRDAITGEYERVTYDIAWGREKRTVKALLTKGTDIETKFNDLAGSYRYMKQKVYCADRHVFIQEVASNLPAWIQAGRPSSQAVAKPQWQVAKDENMALWDELVSLTGGVKSDGTKIPMKYGRNDGRIAKSLMSKQLLAVLSRMTKDGMYSPLLEMTEDGMKFAFNRAVKSSG